MGGRLSSPCPVLSTALSQHVIGRLNARAGSGEVHTARPESETAVLRLFVHTNLIKRCGVKRYAPLHIWRPIVRIVFAPTPKGRMGSHNCHEAHRPAFAPPARAAPQAPKDRAAHVSTRARGYATFHTNATCRHMTSGARRSFTLGVGRRLHGPHRLAEGRSEDARGRTLEGG